MATNEERDDAYRAVGRYVVEFSRLIYQMRLGVCRCLTGGGDPALAPLALGEATAGQIANAFFALCEQVGMLEPDELKVGRRLSRDVTDAIKTRNDVAHGDWVVGEGDPMLQRVKPTRRAGAWDWRSIPVDELDQQSGGLVALRHFVAEFGDICFDWHPLVRYRRVESIRVRDLYLLRDGRVVREGPAAEIGMPRYR